MSVNRFEQNIETYLKSYKPINVKVEVFHSTAQNAKQNLNINVGLLIKISFIKIQSMKESFEYDTTLLNLKRNQYWNVEKIL